MMHFISKFQICKYSKYYTICELSCLRLQNISRLKKVTKVTLFILIFFSYLFLFIITLASLHIYTLFLL